MKGSIELCVTLGLLFLVNSVAGMCEDPSDCGSEQSGPEQNFTVGPPPVDPPTVGPPPVDNSTVCDPTTCVFSPASQSDPHLCAGYADYATCLEELKEQCEPVDDEELTQQIAEWTKKYDDLNCSIASGPLPLAALIWGSIIMHNIF